MKKSIKKFVVFVMMAAIAIYIAVATEMAGAKDYMKAIEGDYAYTGQGTCIISPAGFNTTTQLANPGWSIQSSVTHGVYTFNPDSTGVYQGHSDIITTNSSTLAAFYAAVEMQGSFTYTAESDGVITITSNMPSTGHYLTGQYAGFYFSLDKFEFTGLFRSDTNSIMLVTHEPPIQTATFANGWVVPRLCIDRRLLQPSFK